MVAAFVPGSFVVFLLLPWWAWGVQAWIITQEKKRNI
jgi:hypothetical protein